MESPAAAPLDGVDEARLAVLVDTFYERVRRHPTLGPVFGAAIDDWPAHKDLLTTFWSSVALGSRRYRGNPMARHRGLPIHAQHFDDWLSLWKQACVECLPADAAAHLVALATRIGGSLRYGLGIGERTRGLGLPVMALE